MFFLTRNCSILLFIPIQIFSITLIIILHSQFQVFKFLLITLQLNFLIIYFISLLLLFTLQEKTILLLTILFFLLIFEIKSIFHPNRDLWIGFFPLRVFFLLIVRFIFNQRCPIAHLNFVENGSFLWFKRCFIWKFFLWLIIFDLSDRGRLIKIID